MYSHLCVSDIEPRRSRNLTIINPVVQRDLLGGILDDTPLDLRSSKFLKVGVQFENR